MIPVWLSLLIVALAVMRLTRIVTTDVIALPFRKWVLNRSGDLGWWTMLVHCRYCASVWIGAAAAPAYWFYGGSAWVMVPAIALAFSECIVLTAKLDEV